MLRSPFWRGRGLPCPVFLASAEEMERREAPGSCATAPLRGAGALCRTPQRAFQGRDCESHPETRAGGDLKACEASPPNRCASRRSTAQASRLRKDHEPHCRRPDSRPLAGRVMTAPFGEQEYDECNGGFARGDYFFSVPRIG